VNRGSQPAEGVGVGGSGLLGREKGEGPQCSRWVCSVSTDGGELAVKQGWEINWESQITKGLFHQGVEFPSHSTCGMKPLQDFEQGNTELIPNNIGTYSALKEVESNSLFLKCGLSTVTSFQRGQCGKGKKEELYVRET